MDRLGIVVEADGTPLLLRIRHILGSVSAVSFQWVISIRRLVIIPLLYRHVRATGPARLVMANSP